MTYYAVNDIILKIYSENITYACYFKISWNDRKNVFIASEHNPPHIHIIYNDCVGIIDIRNVTLIEGDLPIKSLNIALEWVKLYQNELIQMWETQNIIQLPPLI